MEFALTYAPATFDLRTKVMGRQSAGLGFLRAALAAKPDRLWCYAASRGMAEAFGRDVVALTETRPELRFILWEQPARLAQAGLLYRADPNLVEDAWGRRHYAHSRAYSLCGVTHTLSSHGAMSTMASLLRAPLYPWDAIVCTSTVARDVMRHTIEAEMEHLRARFGATSFKLPQMPMIPLGTHVSDFSFTPAQRARSRADLGLDANDVAVLFAGRLTFHGKAHPLPMFLALQAAARQGAERVHLVLFGKFANESVDKAFRGEAQQFMPDVRLVVLDGGSDENRDRAWAAADVFTSLSDNIQETFGLTPIEAMAAGLPSVVSDWNGYKDTVRDGVDGFRIPTLLPPPGSGPDLADRHNLLFDDYDHFIGGVCQFTAVDIAAATEAYRTLIGSPERRRTMGEAARLRAADIYDWSVVFRRYLALWDDLAERRRSDPRTADEAARTTRPERPDPFSLFRTYPTAALGPDALLRLAEGGSVGLAAERRALESVAYAAAVLPDQETIERLVGVLSTDWTPLREALIPFGNTSQRNAYRAIAWLAKMGVIEVKRAAT